MTSPRRLQEILLSLGLAEHEASTYLAMLSLGQTSVLRISRASGVKRTTIYSVIESLQQRGLVRLEQRGFKRYFVAEAPEKLESILEQRRDALHAALPEFQAVYNLGASDSLIKYYHGVEAVKSVYEDLLRSVKPGDDYLIVSNPDQWFKLAPEFFTDFLARRARMPLKVRTLFQEDEWGRQRQKSGIDSNQEIRFLPKGTSLTTNLVIVPTRVVVHQLIPPVMAIVIENRSIIQLHRETFEIMWKSIGGSVERAK
ncbi:MAG: hypothetical protein K1X79_05640 [Oligoflexia bacterium]|nr:hypothetical protein [Oligoflexia bacterium]